MLVSHYSFNSSPFLNSAFKPAPFWHDSCPQSDRTDTTEAHAPSPRSVLQWPPWTHCNPKWQLHSQDPLFFLLRCCWLHAHPLGDVKNHHEGRNKATRFSTISPKDLSLSAACSLPLRPWTTLSRPSINNVNENILEQMNNFYSISSGKSSSYPFIVSLLLCLCSMEAALSAAWKQNLCAALGCSWFYPCEVTGQQLSRASPGVEKGLWTKLDCEQCGDRMKPSNFVRAQLSCCRNEKLMTLLYFFLPCSLPLRFLLLEPWSSSKWVL